MKGRYVSFRTNNGRGLGLCIKENKKTILVWCYDKYIIRHKGKHDIKTDTLF